MSRQLLLAIVAVGASAAPAWSGAPAPIPHPIERAFRVPVVVVGKVSSIEKEMVEASPYPGSPKAAHRIAVVKIETPLAGANGLTHLKIGFVPPLKPDPKAKRDPRERPALELKEGEEMLFFLSKHPDGGFYSSSYFTPAIDSKSDNYKAEIENVTKALAIAADPAKALAAEKADDRFLAATVLIARYRTVPEGTSEVELVALAADESKQILKALAEGNWQPDPKWVRINAFYALYHLGIGEAEGWKAPAAKQGEEFSETTRKAFVAWLAGPGKDYRIKKFVPKKTK